MENAGPVKTEQEAASANADKANLHHPAEYNLSNSRSCLSCHPNGVSSFPGKTGSSVMTPELRLLASFAQDVQSNGDSERLKNCEARWLRLFRLVEKQCQEQITAQQKVFYHQIHRIRNEIRHLVNLQHQHVCSCARQRHSAHLASSLPSLGSPMGLQSEASDEHDLFARGLQPSHPASSPEDSAAHPECFGNSASTSSGYGTYSAAELSPRKPTDVPMCMENTEGPAKGQGGPSSPREGLVTPGIPSKRECAQAAIEDGPLVAGDLGCPEEFRQRNEESQCEKTNRKSLTSWAQKLKRNQQKRTSAEEGNLLCRQGKEQTRTGRLEPTNPGAALPPSYPFYLSQQNGSQNSLVSDTSGLTYWKLDEKEMFHTLPEKFENEFSIFSPKAPPEQMPSAEEMKPSTLKDIYHQKQRDNMQLVDWNLSSSQSTHPPEILTLDPTLHLKPDQRNPGYPPLSFCGSSERGLFSPDSMGGSAFFAPSDPDSFSHTGTVRSPPSAGSPKYASSTTTALHTDPWNSGAFPDESNANRHAHRSREILSPEDEENLTLTPSSAGGSLLQSAEESMPDYSLSTTCMADPVVLSKIRQNLREKHARHIADLRAYYDSEIQSLRQQLEASHKSPSEDFKKINQNLVDRCEQLEAALNEANDRMRSLENKNNTLEMELTDWKERFCAASSAAKALQGRVEEMRACSKEKDNTISRLKRRLKDLEEAFEKAYKLSDNKEARLKEENKMFQNLLGEYESLGKEHERIKDTLNVTENKLLDANTQISDLKRTVSKLEAQIKQLEHENMLKFRHLADSHFGTSYANKRASSDVSRRKWLIPGSEYSIFTGQPLGADESPKDNRLEETFPACRDPSPPEKDLSPDCSLMRGMAKKESRGPETPIIKAFKELEERKASKNWGTQAEKEEEEEEEGPPTKASGRRGTIGFDDTAINTSRSPEKGKDLLRHKRFSSPNGPRSSSLPPSNRKSNTPTTREIMLTPVAVTYSPKRSPKENLSPGFSHLLGPNENMVTRFDILLDDLEAAPSPASRCRSSRKKLQFRSAEEAEELKPTSLGRGVKTSPGTDPAPAGAKKSTTEPAWEEGSFARTAQPRLSSTGPAPYEADSSYISRIKTLAGMERLFDELTYEKQQIEAQLSRIPSTGGRMTLQARLNQEALEDRLDRINRELGSIRMILKKYHVLRTSANI